MKNLLYAIMIAILAFSVSCSDFVTSVDPLISQVQDDQLNSEVFVDALIRGIQASYSEVHVYNNIFASLLSDESYATISAYSEFDAGSIDYSFFVAESQWSDLADLRFHADNLVERTAKISFSTEDLEKKALYYGNLYAGLARYYYAFYWGLDQSNGGGVITVDPDEPGAFVPTSEMAALAIDCFQVAYENAGDAYEARVVKTLMARTALFNGDYTAAATHAALGMSSGDEPFQSLHENTNGWYSYCSTVNKYVALDMRFIHYINEDPQESNRIKLIVQVADGDTALIQNHYEDKYTPVTITSWQENELMLAELAIWNSDQNNALTHINNVRGSYGLGDLTLEDMTMETIIEERDKELFLLGTRLLDQRRFDLWHLQEGTWQFLPIPASERTANSNLQ